jgi:hypothetical protein
LKQFTNISAKEAKNQVVAHILFLRRVVTKITKKINSSKESKVQIFTLERYILDNVAQRVTDPETQDRKVTIQYFTKEKLYDFLFV